MTQLERHADNPMLKYKELGPGYDHTSETLVITHQERALGIETHRLFNTKLKRPLPWVYRNGVITIDRPLKDGEVERIPGEKGKADLRSRIIITDNLANETISEPLAGVIVDVKMVEDKLPFYMRWAKEFSQTVWGYNDVYGMWDTEENQHGNAFGLILTSVKRPLGVNADSQEQAPDKNSFKTLEQIEAEYYKNLAHTWVPPFKTRRQIAAYANIQEKVTANNYERIKEAALREGALTVAAIFDLIGRDENYHHGVFRRLLEEEYKIDPEGTRQDVFYVSTNFEMPAQTLLENPIRSLRNLVKIGAFERDRIGRDSVFPALNALSFVTIDEARNVAKLYEKAA